MANLMSPSFLSPGNTPSTHSDGLSNTFDTGTSEGRKLLAREAILAINENTKLRSGLTSSSLRQLLARYSSHVQRYDGQILSTVQTSEEGQESLDLAFRAATDMAQRLKAFSDNAAQLKEYVDDLQKDTRPYELAQKHLEESMTVIEKLALLSERTNSLRQLRLTPETKSEYYRRSAELLSGIQEHWPSFEAQKTHHRLAPMCRSIEAAKASLGINCRAELKAAQHLVLRAAPGEPLPFELTDTLDAAAAAMEALGTSFCDEVVDGFCFQVCFLGCACWRMRVCERLLK
jgi:hypothetical protein